MNTKRIIFWASFIIVLILIVWGLIVAMGKTPITPGSNVGVPAPISDADNVFGPSDAPVTIIEYSDYQCPACQVYNYMIERLLASSTVPIRFVYRHFPLPYHKNAIPASLAVEASGLQGKYLEMHKLVFDNQSDWEDRADTFSIFTKYATEIGLDLEKFSADSKSQVLKDKINAQKDEGVKIRIGGTPTFFVNGKVIVNPQGYDEFKTIIEQAAKQSL